MGLVDATLLRRSDQDLQRVLESVVLRIVTLVSPTLLGASAVFRPKKWTVTNWLGACVLSTAQMGVVGHPGLEPGTSVLSGLRSNHLS